MIEKEIMDRVFTHSVEDAYHLIDKVGVEHIAEEVNLGHEQFDIEHLTDLIIDKAEEFKNFDERCSRCRGEGQINVPTTTGPTALDPNLKPKLCPDCKGSERVYPYKKYAQKIINLLGV